MFIIHSQWVRNIFFNLWNKNFLYFYIYIYSFKIISLKTERNEYVYFDQSTNEKLSLGDICDRFNF